MTTPTTSRVSDAQREAFEAWLNQGHRCGCNESMWKAWQSAVRQGKDRLLSALERASKAESLLRVLIDECDASAKAGWEDRMTDYIAKANALLSSSGPITCQTCGGSGWIGGPSYYDPGEGGEPCTDCYRSRDGYVEFLDVQNHRLRKAIQSMMAYLAPILDADHFNRADEMVRDLGIDPHDSQAEKDRKVGESWRLDSSLEKWFPITAEEIDRLKAALASQGDVVAVSEVWDVIRKEATYAGHMKREARAISIDDLSALLNRGGK